eukprot:TRINITY_DN16401_c0_g1_i12.p2 TRINITY_DN16401_c0_g1~~TRINITY_DN16401_c0_g1_i12.p2  ORF type:complete len:148 (+),score=8.01 TRINITY_DN16401_c0_g1_i12:28-471(+)
MCYSACAYCFCSISFFFFFLMTRRPPRSTLSSSSAASDVYKRQVFDVCVFDNILGWEYRTQPGWRSNSSGRCIPKLAGGNRIGSLAGCISGRGVSMSELAVGIVMTFRFSPSGGHDSRRRSLSVGRLEAISLGLPRLSPRDGQDARR